jgi:hypothetical protein
LVEEIAEAEHGIGGLSLAVPDAGIIDVPGAENVDAGIDEVNPRQAHAGLLLLTAA